MNTSRGSCTRSAEESPSGKSAASALLDDAFFDSMTRQHIGRMLATAQRILKNEQDSRDAVQDAFLQAFKCRADFKGQSQIGTWLHRITVNAALMRLRKQRRQARVSIEPLLPTFDETGHRVDAQPAWTASPDELLEKQEVREMVRQRIDDLPDDYRTVILLRDIESLSTEATAELLNLTCGAVKTRLHRARMALRSLLEPELV